MRYEVRNYTLEKQGFINCFTLCGIFKTKKKAKEVIKDLESKDKIFGVSYEYYIKEVEWS